MARDVKLTFVSISASKAVAVPTSSAVTLKASICICAVGVDVTSAIVNKTLVNVNALAVESSSDVFVANVTGTVVSSPEVCTKGIAVATVKSEVGAFVDVKAGVVADAVAVETRIACAGVAAHCVVASCFLVARCILGALIDIDTGSIIVSTGKNPVESVTDITAVMRAMLDWSTSRVKIAVATNKVGLAGAANDAGDREISAVRIKAFGFRFAGFSTFVGATFGPFFAVRTLNDVEKPGFLLDQVVEDRLVLVLVSCQKSRLGGQN